MQKRLDQQMDTNKPFENVSCQGRIQKFFQLGGTEFCCFSKRIFPAELILNNLSIKNDSREIHGHAPPKKF